MNPITEKQLLPLANLFDERLKVETTFKDCRIIIEESVGEFDYEILTQDPVKFQWHTWHSDEGFPDVESAIKAAEKWIDNYDGPGDEYYAQ